MIWGVNMTKVSVIMPVYNCADVLKRAVEAVLNQTLDDIELILVDDCSNDGSGEIIDEYSKKHEMSKPFICRRIPNLLQSQETWASN